MKKPAFFLWREKDDIIQGSEEMNLKEILTVMIEKNASDLHLVVGNQPCFVINGKLSYYDDRLLTRNDLKAFLDEVIDDDERKQKFLTQKELDFAYELEGKARFRVNAYFQRNSIAFAVRMVPLNIRNLEALHLPEELKEFTTKRSGLVLVIGPAKTGKSTTVAAMVNRINETLPLHIVTIEDPIEYVYKPKKSVISQREVKEDTHSFAAALRHIVRQSPGVIVVDGVKDKDSVKMILEAAETGHLVFCTLQTWNAIQSVNKLLDFFSDSEKKQVRIQISHTLKAIISQRLLRRKDGNGFACACEVLKVNQTIRNLIREDEQGQMLSVMEDLRREGMITLSDRFLALYKQGIVDLAEIEEFLPDKKGNLDTFLLQ